MVDQEKEKMSSQQFLEEMYQNYHRLMYQIACKWMDSTAEQEDVVQESLVKLIEKEDLLRTLKKESLVSYIAYTVRNTTFKHLNKKARSSKLHTPWEDDGLLEENSSDTAIDERIMQEELRQDLKRVWATLPEREKLLLEGKYVFRETDEELAKLLGCKPESVRMALTRARRVVIQRIKEVSR